MAYYTEKMQGLVRVHSEMHQERKQIMVDSLNKLVLFETSVDMTLKYDTKMFAKMIEEIQIQEQSELGITLEDENSNNKSSNDESRGQEQTPEVSTTAKEEDTKNSTENSPTKSDHYKGIGNLFIIILDAEYLEYIAEFDQLGEYKYSEAPIEEEYDMSSHRIEMTDQIKSKYEEEIYELVENCIENKSSTKPSPDIPEESKLPHEEYVQKMDNFNILMSERTARTVFLDSLNNYSMKKDTKLNSWDSFNQLSEMVLI